MPEPRHDPAALKAILARLEASEVPLDPETACRLHALGQTTRRFVRYLGASTGDGGGEHRYEVDDAWRVHHVDERDLPDRSIDAAVALVQRILPKTNVELDFTICADDKFVGGTRMWLQEFGDDRLDAYADSGSRIWHPARATVACAVRALLARVETETPDVQ